MRRPRRPVRDGAAHHRPAASTRRHGRRPPPCPPVQPKGSTWQLRLTTAPRRTTCCGTSAAHAGWSGRAARPEHSCGCATRARSRPHDLEGLVDLPRPPAALGLDAVRHRRGGRRLDAVQVIEDDATAAAWTSTSGASPRCRSRDQRRQALKAQAIAARTYAAKRAGRVLMPTPADQNYTGYAKELEDKGSATARGDLRWRAAVDATTGQVVTSAATGALIDTLYSSSVGGHSEDERYVWGVEAPLPARRRRLALGAGVEQPGRQPVVGQGVSWGTLASKLGFTSISAISVPARGAARAAGVKVTGPRRGAAHHGVPRGLGRTAGARPALAGLRDLERLRSAGRPRPRSSATGTVTATTTRAGSARPRRAARSPTRRARWTKRYRYGTPGDVPVVGDWDGDGEDDVGVFRAGTWLLRNGQTGGTADQDIPYGVAGDVRWSAGGRARRWASAWSAAGLAAADHRHSGRATADVPLWQVGDVPWSATGTATAHRGRCAPGREVAGARPASAGAAAPTSATARGATAPGGRRLGRQRHRHRRGRARRPLSAQRAAGPATLAGRRRRRAGGERPAA